MNLGDLTVSFSINLRRGLPDHQPQVRRCRTRAASGAKAECRGGIAKRRITKCGEKGGEKVGAPRSTCEAGEQLSPGPCGGKGVPGHRPVVRKPGEGFVPRSPVNATTTDSAAEGETVT